MVNTGNGCVMTVFLKILKCVSAIYTFILCEMLLDYASCICSFFFIMYYWKCSQPFFGTFLCTWKQTKKKTFFQIFKRKFLFGIQYMAKQSEKMFFTIWYFITSVESHNFPVLNHLVGFWHEPFSRTIYLVSNCKLLICASQNFILILQLLTICCDL